VMSEPRFLFETPEPSSVAAKSLVPAATGVPERSPVPAAAPDGFGAGVNPIDFGQTLAGEPMNYVVFMPDGSARDNLGNFNSGVVYLNLPADLYTSRAVTVWGSTGRVRGWRLNQIGAVGTWVQQ